MTTELTKAAQQALEALQRAKYAQTQQDPVIAHAMQMIEDALTQRPAAQEVDAEQRIPKRAGEPMPPPGPVVPACSECTGCREWGGNGLWHHWPCSRIPKGHNTAWLEPAPQQATPEPVGEPAAWRWFNSNGDQVTNWLDFKPSQKASVDAQVAEAGGRVEYAYTRPAPGVPEGLPAVLTDWGFDVHDDEEGRTWLTIRNPDDDVARMSVPTVWPLNGNQTISAVVLHQFSAALTSALAAAQAKGDQP